MIRPPLTLNAWLRYDSIMDALRRMDHVDSILEIGSGGGALGARLAKRYSYTAVEPDLQSFQIAARRLASFGRGTVLNSTAEARQGDGPFDVVCAFEVLEHIEDDLGALRTWHSFIRPGGWLLISVPAYQHRFSSSDERVGHFRRYDPAHLVHVLNETGFDHPSISLYGFPLGYILEWIRNKVALWRPNPEPMASRTSESGRLHQPAEAFGLVTFLLALPFRAAQRVPASHSIGTGLVACARRRL